VTEDTTVKSNHFKASEDDPKIRVKSEKSGKEVRLSAYVPAARMGRTCPEFVQCCVASDINYATTWSAAGRVAATASACGL
jgi:hypothetical protein